MNHTNYVLESAGSGKVPLYYRRPQGRFLWEDLRDGMELTLYRGVEKFLLLQYAEYRRTDTLRMLEG